MTAEASGVAYYQRAGHGYSQGRRPDPRIAAAIHDALGDARTVLNVGAGTGSYEPDDRAVVAVEPSAVMIAQRTSSVPIVRAVAEALPFAEASFDAAMGVLTIHHWTDWRRGLAELRRVARRIVLLTHDSEPGSAFWLFDYFPGILERDRVRMPPVEEVANVLGGRVVPVLVPHDCSDGFLGAFWRSPEVYLDPAVRGRMSGFGLLSEEAVAEGVARLESDLASGRWEARHGGLLTRESIDIGYRLVVAGDDDVRPVSHTG